MPGPMSVPVVAAADLSSANVLLCLGLYTSVMNGTGNAVIDPRTPARVDADTLSAPTSAAGIGTTIEFRVKLPAGSGQFTGGTGGVSTPSSSSLTGEDE